MLSPLLGRPFNEEYDPRDLTEAVAALNSDRKQSKAEAPNVIARKQYFTYAAKSNYVPIPYTDYDGLVKYCELNDVDYVFLNYDYLSGYPFLNQIDSEFEKDFNSVFSSSENYLAQRIDLFRFRGDSIGSRDIAETLKN